MNLNRQGRRAPEVHITFTDDAVTAIRYSTPGRPARQLTTIEPPPNYEDVNAVSVPMNTNLVVSSETSDPLLPTYDESSNM